MKIPRQSKNAPDPDFALIKFLVRLCARSKTKQVHDLDFARSSSEEIQVEQKQLMIHILPRYFFFAFLGIFSHELYIKGGLMNERNVLLSDQYIKKGYIRNKNFGNTKISYVFFFVKVVQIFFY